MSDTSQPSPSDKPRDGVGGFVAEFDGEMSPQEVIGRLRSLADFREPHKLGAEPQRAWRAACHDAANMIERFTRSAGTPFVALGDLKEAEETVWACTGSAFLAGEKCDPNDRQAIYLKLCTVGNLIAAAREELSVHSASTPITEKQIRDAFRDEYVAVDDGLHLKHCNSEEVCVAVFKRLCETVAPTDSRADKQ